MAYTRFASVIRDKNIAKGSFRFANSLYLEAALAAVKRCLKIPLSISLKNMSR